MSNRQEIENVAILAGLTTSGRVSRLRTCELRKMTAHLRPPVVAPVVSPVVSPVVEVPVVEEVPVAAPAVVASIIPHVLQSGKFDSSDQKIIEAQKAALALEQQQAVELMDDLEQKIVRKQHILKKLSNVGRLQVYVYERELGFLISLFEELQTNISK